MKITKIAFGGGPGSGKSSVFEALRNCVSDKIPDTAVVFLPEAATFFFSNRGSTITAQESAEVRQHYIYSTQLLLEEAIIESAKVMHTENLIILSDRGILDCEVYVDESEVGKVTGKESIPYDHYDFVLLFTGIANIQSDTTFRTEENDEERLRVANRSYRVWSRAKNLTEIPQFPNVDDKIEMAKTILNRFLGQEMFL